MTEVIARCVPRVTHWLLGLFYCPLAGFMLAGVVPAMIGLEPWFGLQGPAILTAWVAATLGIMALAFSADYRRQYFTLHADHLVLGRGAAGVAIPFAEIESMVLALPEHLPWWVRLQRYSPKGRRIYKNVVKNRAGAVLLRLTGNRYLPLNMCVSHLASGRAFMQEFLRLNQSRIVGPESYIDGEIEGLATAKMNRVKVIVPAANPTRLRQAFAAPPSPAQQAAAEREQRFDY
jgi:hypothetical protein